MQQNNNENENIPKQQNPNVNTNILYVSDLPNNTTEEDIKSFFKEYLEKIKLISINPSKINPTNNKVKSPTASIIFSESKIADLAKRNLNLKKIKGKTVRIMWHTKDKNIIDNPDTNIYIKNIPDLVTPRQVLEHFSQFGEVLSAKIPENEEGNHFGFGYINYVDQDSALNAIKSENGKKIWNSVLEVMPFQLMKNRVNTLVSNNSNILYLRDFPSEFSEREISEICKNFGEILSCKIISSEKFKEPYAVLSFQTPQAAENAKNGLNKLMIGNKILKAENYKTKEEKNNMENYLNSENINNNVGNFSNYLNTNSNNNFLPKLGNTVMNNNLHVRNIPFDANENDLVNCFQKFGEIKSTKIDRINLVTKINDEYKEIPTSQGFGYVCFATQESAQKAKEAMDGKYLPKFEMWKRPLLIDFFVPKNQRKNHYTKPMNYYDGGNTDKVADVQEGDNANRNVYAGNQQNSEFNNFYQGNNPNFYGANQDGFNMQNIWQGLPAMPPMQNQMGYPNKMNNRNFNNVNSMNMLKPQNQQNQQFYQKQMMQNAAQNMNMYQNNNLYSKIFILIKFYL